MQITFGWNCRECHREVTMVRDTERFPMRELPYHVALRCSACDHESGDLFLAYSFEWAKHAPKGAMRIR